MGGSVVEALLLWALSRQDGTAVQEAAKRAVERKRLTDAPRKSLTDWMLFQYIPVALEMQLVSERTAGLCDTAREFRNLIHPGAAERSAAACNNGTAYAALAAVYAVSNDLKKAFGRGRDDAGIAHA